MYLLGSFSRSTSTTPLHTKTPIGNVMTVLCPNTYARQTQHTPGKSPRYTRHHHTRPLRPTPATSALSHDTAESIFFHALARASLCKKHSEPNYAIHTRHHSTHNSSHLSIHLPSTSSTHDRNATQTPPAFSTTHRRNHAAAHSLHAIPREELRDLVNLYDFESDPWDQQHIDQKHSPIPVPVEDIPRHAHPTLSNSTDAHVNRHLISSENENFPSDPPREYPNDVPQYHDQIHHIVQLLQDPLTPHDTLHGAYSLLPSPRIAYLQDRTIRKLMHHFSQVEYKSEQSMLRYLSLVDDLTAANIPLTTEEWNSAISFAGRWARRTRDLQVETSTQIWLRMEREAGVKSDNVTFNILFDVAAKAGKFALAEVVMKEMITRGLPENRFFRTNKIYYYGVKRDGSAVRRAYKDLVDAGEFVDTVVLNCVIASLIRAGEASAAEHIFERMKAIHSEKTSTLIPAGWRKQRQLGRVLDKAAKALRNDPERRSALQEATPITPNLHTYRLLIKYHAHESGNIDRVTELLDEMHHMQIRMHGSIFVQLFKGFKLHGGVRYSSWTKPRLEKLWAVFLDFVHQTEEYNRSHPHLLDEEDRGCYYDVGIVITVLQAFNKIAGRDCAMEIWHDILDEWRPEGDALDVINGVLANMFAHSGE